MRWRSLLARWRQPKGTRLHIAADVGQGPVIILVHGIASTSATYSAVIPLLEPDHRVIAIDLLGFGDSPAGEQYTAEEHVAALYETIRSLRLREPFMLVGHSLGALLSARYALLYPEQVRALLLLSPPVYSPPHTLSDPLARHAVEQYLRAYELLRGNRELAMFSGTVFSRFYAPGVFELNDENWDAFSLSLLNCVEHQTLLYDVAQLRCPVEVIYGGLDQFLPPGGMDVLSRLAGIRVHRIEAMTHVVGKRYAKHVNRVIRAAAQPAVPAQ